MQFACESCNAMLQIADEKVRGKRLVVRCKRCGAQIRIADPALGASQWGAGPSSRASATSHSGAKPSTGPIPAASHPAARPRVGPATDAESTRAMDSEVLEKALRASKGDDAAAAALSHLSARRSSPPPPPPDEPQPRDPPIWFAMIAGKQTGPITRAELGLKSAQGQVGPRTYLWKEGMDSWVRAKDVAEVSSLFAPPRPEPDAQAAPNGLAGRKLELPFEARSTPVPAPAAQPIAGSQLEPSASEEKPAEQAPPPSGALDLARWGADELGKQHPITPADLPKARPVPRVPGLLAAHAASRRDPLRLTMAALGTAVLAALLAFALLWGREERTEPRAEQPAAQQGKADPEKPAEKAPEPQKPAEPAQAQSQPSPGLSVEVVARKIAESKPALQACIDEALGREPALRVGRIHIATTVAPSGAVTSARIDRSSVDQSPLGSCLKGATRRIQFPAFSGDPFPVDIPIVVSGD